MVKREDFIEFQLSNLRNAIAYLDKIDSVDDIKICDQEKLLLAISAVKSAAAHRKAELLREHVSNLEKALT